MICPKCEAITPNSYKLCPDCKTELVRERFIEVKNEGEIVETIISPLVECGELKIEEF